jgi:transposase
MGDYTNKKGYANKTIYVGIDVHKKTYAVTCMCEEAIVKRDTLKASPEGLLDYLNKYFPGAKIRSVYEAGFSGLVLHRYLTSNGIMNIVVHAASVEISARDRVKTDKRDSMKLAIQLSNGRLRGIHIPSEEREAYRELSRLRDKVSSDKRRIGNRLKSLLMRQGLLHVDNDQKMSERWLKQVVLNYECHESVKCCIRLLVNEWLYLKQQMKQIEEELKKQAEIDNELEKIYRSVPGIGAVHSRVLANELENMGRFENEKQLFSFTGLTPSEHSSGEHKRLGHITRQGRSQLRHTLVLAAWKAIKNDRVLRGDFERISASAGKKRAIVAIARKLIGHIRSCFKNNSVYQKKIEMRTETGEIVSVCRKTGEILSGECVMTTT